MRLGNQTASLVLGIILTLLPATCLLAKTQTDQSALVESLTEKNQDLTEQINLLIARGESETIRNKNSIGPSGYGLKLTDRFRPWYKIASK